jgi:ferredoxin-NADP reductase
MSVLSGRLATREKIADATWLFQLESEEPLAFAAGQSIDLTLSDPPWHDASGDKRAFSIASAPNGNRLTIASRVRGSAFKRSLVEGPLGLAVEIEGPFGSMTLPESGEPVVMLAGGIGVTPFRAIVEDAIARGRTNPLLLVHSNRAPGEAPFLSELQRWGSTSPHFRYVPTMTGKAPGWSGARHRLDADWLAEISPGDRSASRWFLAGPDRFIQGVGATLASMGVAMERVAMEQFSGY